MTERGQSKPPTPELASFIDLANQTEDLKRIREWLKQPHDTASPSKLAKTVTARTRRFLGPTSDDQQFRENCLSLDAATHLLDQISDEPSLLNDYGSGTLSLSVNLYLDSNGAIAASGTVLNAISGAKADRIRKCSIEKCGKIFWAPRSNSECCSPTHRDTLNQRRSRENRLYKRRIGRKGR